MRLYDTLSRSLVELPPPPGPIRMYFCGPTVYARAHIGNARPFVVGMWLRSWLRSRGYDAQLVHNITDINDKIYDAAPSASAHLAAEATEWYFEDTGDLGLGMPDYLPKATESVPQIVAFIEELIARGNAYESVGDVYFSVDSYPEYGQLSRRKSDQVEQGEEPSSLKRDSRDFALWKANKPATEDTWWDSPWGRGRPGWHIECSVMAEEIYGPAFEIHGGGLDLVFPHHENEVAQSRALGHPFASIWTHNGMLQFTGDKMSKSAGNVTTIRDAIDKWGRETILVFFLTASWRKPIDFSDETMLQAASQWAGLQGAFRVAKAEPGPAEWTRFEKALDDDFNTPDALAVLHDWRSRGYWGLLDKGLRIFGLELPTMAGTGIEAERLRDDRDAARNAKDWAKADELRDAIRKMGYDVVDESSGSRLVPL